MKNKRNDTFFFLIIAIILISLYCLLQPKIYPYYLSNIRKISRIQFLNDIQKNKQIDPQKFWKFREFYYPGIIYYRNFIDKKRIKPLLDRISPVSKYAEPLIEFKSNYMYSLDVLIDKVKIRVLEKYLIANRKKAIVATRNILFFQENKNSIILIFFLPVEELKKANRYLDYKEKDKKFVENKYWINISKITW